MIFKSCDILTETDFAYIGEHCLYGIRCSWTGWYMTRLYTAVECVISQCCRHVALNRMGGTEKWIQAWSHRPCSHDNTVTFYNSATRKPLKAASYCIQHVCRLTSQYNSTNTMQVPFMAVRVCDHHTAYVIFTTIRYVNFGTLKRPFFPIVHSNRKHVKKYVDHVIIWNEWHQSRIGYTMSVNTGAWHNTGTIVRGIVNQTPGHEPCITPLINITMASGKKRDPCTAIRLDIWTGRRTEVMLLLVRHLQALYLVLVNDVVAQPHVVPRSATEPVRLCAATSNTNYWCWF